MAPTHRRLLVGVVVLALLAVAAVVLVWSRSSSYDGASRVAQRYVALVASGKGPDLSRLAAMTAGGGSPERDDAADLLAGAEQRIEVLDLAGPKRAGRAVDLPGDLDLEDLVEVEVRYRLAGSEHTWPLVLGRQDGEWRVAVPMLGSVAWDEPALQGLDSEIRLGAVVLDRRPRSGAGEQVVAGGQGAVGEVQPLYPAVYAFDKRIGAWFASARTRVSVLPGEPSAQPAVTLEATGATLEALADDLTDRAEACDGQEAFARCPFFDLVATPRAGGGDPYASGWWQGLVGEPEITVEGTTARFSGAFRYEARSGSRTMRFTGEADVALSSLEAGPTLGAPEVERAG
ncbi:hypothetical protein KG112_07525 [Nocardioides sp. zg-ZUI104]|uniref:hypothetical protein n=1 Tax=Nocardioides faecalis TaxID=2803858 RepID=UPI001BD11B4C|nr:hypothetical protein [Nocardioides faecalis]MBS4752658.1 hypothetical protein [Nocardioides faecalis]